jgi:hypothetical protein
MEQVIIEEQNKPLELDTAAFTRIMDLVSSLAIHAGIYGGKCLIHFTG